MAPPCVVFQHHTCEAIVGSLPLIGAPAAIPAYSVAGGRPILAQHIEGLDLSRSTSSVRDPKSIKHSKHGRGIKQRHIYRLCFSCRLPPFSFLESYHLARRDGLAPYLPSFDQLSTFFFHTTNDMIQLLVLAALAAPAAAHQTLWHPAMYG